MTDAVKIIGIDPATNGGGSVAYIVNKDVLGNLQITNPPWPALDISQILKDYDRLKMPMSAKMFREQYENDFGRERSPRELDFVRSAIRAAKLCRGEMISPDMYVEDPRRLPGDYLNAWIFGPMGEFTGFARLYAMSDVDKVARYERHPDPLRVTKWTPSHPDLREFEFDVQVIHNGFTAANFYHIGNMRGAGYEPDCVFYIRFGSYDDYAAWARMAGGDRTAEEVTIERY